MWSKHRLMTSYYRHLDPSGLRINEELIIMTEALQYCENNGIAYIRYSKLRSLSDDTLTRIMRGGSGMGAGNFEANIKKLTSEERPFFKHVKISTRHVRLYPNIAMIKAYRMKFVDHSNDASNYNIVVRGLPPESFTIGDSVDMKVIHANESN